MATPTTITRQNTPVGRVAPANGAARFEDGGGAVLAVMEPYTGSKADSAWHHRILSPVGNELGDLTLMTVHTGWTDIRTEATQFLLNETSAVKSALSRRIAPTQRAGRSRVGGRIGRGVR